MSLEPGSYCIKSELIVIESNLELNCRVLFDMIKFRYLGNSSVELLSN